MLVVAEHGPWQHADRAIGLIGRFAALLPRRSQVLLSALRRIGLRGTAMARDLRHDPLKLLKVGAQVTRSVRRIRVAMASSCPQAGILVAAHRRLRAAA